VCVCVCVYLCFVNLNLLTCYESKTVNTLVIEQIKKILHIYSNSWYSTISL